VLAAGANALVTQYRRVPHLITISLFSHLGKVSFFPQDASIALWGTGLVRLAPGSLEEDALCGLKKAAGNALGISEDCAVANLVWFW